MKRYCKTDTHTHTTVCIIFLCNDTTQALSHFEAAEKGIIIVTHTLHSSVTPNRTHCMTCPVLVDPGFYMVNWLWMGKCHLDLGHTQEAKTWLQRVVKYETTLEEEVEVCIINIPYV